MARLRYLLDTNICIYLLKKQPPEVIARFAACQRGEIAISAITWAELSCGLGKHNQPSEMATLLGKLQPQEFDFKAAEQFGQLSQLCPTRKNSFDRMIAAHAMALNVILVTNNTADFSIYTEFGLQLENWVS